MNNNSGSMFGLPTTTSSGVPLFTMEQIQQLQQQRQQSVNNNNGQASSQKNSDAFGSSNNTGASDSSSLQNNQSAAQGPPQPQRTLSANTLLSQYVLGQDVAPRGQQQSQTTDNSLPFFGSTGTTPPNFDSFSDAALWKLFWDESTPNATGNGSSESASALEEPNDLATPTNKNSSTANTSHQYSASSMYSSETVRAQNPVDRMNSPSPTPSAMSCSTAESKPHKSSVVAPSSSQMPQPVQPQQQPQLTQQQPWSMTAPTSSMGTSSSDQLTLMLQQFHQQQQQMQNQVQQRQQQQALPSSMFPSQPRPMSSMPGGMSAPPAFAGQGYMPTQTLSAMDTPKSAQDINNASLLIPSIVMPPSVMTSVMSPAQTDDSDSYQAQEQQRRRKNTGGGGSKRATKSFRQESPQHCLDRLLLQSRGFSPGQLRVKAEAAAYDTSPSPLQLASFGTEFVRAIHTSDLSKLSQMLNCGLSPNPCNQFRDSIVDLVCKRANAPVFRVLVEHGADLRVCDGFGRTPLHHCGWASTFSPEIATIILQRDWRQLFVEDKRGQTPLEYVREELFDEWIAFLQNSIDRIVPQHIPPLEPMKLQRPDGYLPDPINAISPKLAMAVSAGRITPQQVQQMSPEMKARFDG